jgi:hypothetical protein
MADGKNACKLAWLEEDHRNNHAGPGRETKREIAAMIKPTSARIRLAVLCTLLASLAFVLATTNTIAQPAVGGPSSAGTNGQPSDADILLDFFQKKGVITDQDVSEAHKALSQRTNAVSSAPALSSPWKVSDTFRSIQLFGDFRLRYEYRGMDNIPGATPDTYYRERFRYALRFGIRGDLVDDFYYGIRFETAANPRSPWDTFGNNTTAGSVTPSDKSGSGIGIGQAYLGWRPTTWYEMTAGRMAMPLYTTPMVWDSDINPEGAFEKFKYTVDDVDLFADFGQFDYVDPGSANGVPSSDTFVLAWQLGAVINLSSNVFVKIAPTFYDYTGVGPSGNGLNLPFVGQGNAAGVNAGLPGGAATNLAPYNENGINNLTVLEVPAEFDVKVSDSVLGPVQLRAFGDFAYNFDGDRRARAAFAASPSAFPGLSGAATGQNLAYQAGLGIGSGGSFYGPTQGLVYGSYCRRGAWEARAYWQHIEQYSLDVNLIDSDFFEGRANLQGAYLALAYGITDAIIGTVRYGHASRIRNELGTGGNNLDIPGINPVNNYNLIQTDLTWRF